MRRLVALVPGVLAVLSTFAAKPAEKLLKRLHMPEKQRPRQISKNSTPSPSS